MRPQLRRDLHNHADAQLHQWVTDTFDTYNRVDLDTLDAAADVIFSMMTAIGAISAAYNLSPEAVTDYFQEAPFHYQASLRRRQGVTTMISIHRVASLTAKTSTSSDSHWLTLTMAEPEGEPQIELTIYFSTRRRGFEEENRFAHELAAAINSVRPMEIGNWEPHSSPTAPLGAPRDHPVEGDLGTVPL